MSVLRSLPMVPRVRCRSPPRAGAGRGGGHYSMAMQAVVAGGRQPPMNTFASRRRARPAGYHGPGTATGEGNPRGAKPHRQAGTVVLADLEHVLRVDRKSTRLNSSHVKISYAVFCLKKKK